MTSQSTDFSFAQLPTTLAINRRPLLITAPGDYVTRDGRRVTIRSITPYAPVPGNALRHEVTAFEAKGSVWRVFRGAMRPRYYDIWHLSGAYHGQQSQPLDIVGAWVGDCAL